jgi:hypothetical protein
MQNMPTIKFELEGVKYSMISAIMDSMDEIKHFTMQSINGAMNQLLEGQLEAQIIRVTSEAIDQSLRKVVEDVVRVELNDFFYSEQGNEIIMKAVREGITIGDSKAVRGD